METKPYRLGIIVGRFQTLHLGHQDMIAKAAAICGRVGVFIGSSQESGTAKNPFPYELRKRILEKLCSDTVDVWPLPDIGVGNNALWGDYVLENVKARYGMWPDLMISGKEDRRLDWFDSVAGASVAELYVPKTIDISATRMRAFFIENDEASWRRYADERIWDEYETMRQAVLASKDVSGTDSL